MAVRKNSAVLSEQSFDPAHKEMGTHLAAGIFNSGIVQIVKIACQFTSVIVISRLLTPAEFGIYAMAGPVFGFVSMFQDLGLSQATVQKPKLTHDEINAFFWINIVVGLILTAFVAGISPLVGMYYGEPKVVPLTMAMSLLIFASSLGNQHGAILTRRMEFRTMAYTGVLGAVCGLSVSIICALLFKNYWALFFGLAAGIIIPVCAMWFVTGWRPTIPRKVPGLSHMLKFGAGITGANLAGFISGNIDNVLIGHRWGEQELGLYDRAYKLLLFPMQRIVGPLTYTMVPVLSRLTHDPKHYRSIYLKITAQLTLAAWPGIIWAIVLVNTLVPTLLGKQWAGSAAIFEPLAIVSLLQMINTPAVCLFISQGRAGEFARWSVFSSIFCVMGFVIGLPYGPIGVALSLAIGECVRTPILWWYIGRKGPVGSYDPFRAILPQIGSGLCTALILIGYRHVVHAAPILLLAGGLALSYITTAATMSLTRTGRETLKETLHAGHRMIKHALAK